MSFKGLGNKLALRLVDWGLPSSIIRGFIEELDRQFSELDPSDIPNNRRLGMNTTVIVTDPNDRAGIRYVFFVRFARNDDDYWVSDINCAGITVENKLFWTPP